MMKKLNKNLSEKVAGATGTVSGAASIMGSWQVCHSLCIGLITLLGAIGITVTGMPLLFLTTLAVPLWSIAVVLLGVVMYFFFARHCISGNLILFNSGLIIAGIPFQAVQSLQPGFWIIGGLIAAAGAGRFIIEKIRNRREAKKKCKRC